MKTKFTLLLITIIFSAQAQVVTTLGNVAGTVTVNVPVAVDNFSNIGALSLTILYDNTVAAYEGLVNTHPSLTGVFGFDAGGSIGLSWLDLTLQGATLTNGEKLFDLVFNKVSEGNTTVSFSTAQGACEYSDINANPVLATYVDGSITFNAIGIKEEQGTKLNIIIGANYLKVINQNLEEIQLTNIMGQKVLKIKSNIKYETSTLPSGIYIINAVDIKGNWVSQKIYI